MTPNHRPNIYRTHARGLKSQKRLKCQTQGPDHRNCFPNIYRTHVRGLKVTKKA